MFRGDVQFASGLLNFQRRRIVGKNVGKVDITMGDLSVETLDLSRGNILRTGFASQSHH